MYLRNIFVFALVALGMVYATQGPFYALLFYLWNAYFRPDLWVWSPLIASLKLSFTIAVYLVLATVLSMPKLPFNLRTFLVVLFAAQTLLSTFASEHVDVSWPAWIDFSKVLLVSYLIVVLVTDLKRFRLTLLVIALSFGFEAAKQGWAMTILYPGTQNNNPIGFLGDNNGVALGTMMMVPIFSALAQTAATRREAFLHRFFLVGVFMRGITTYSRGGFIAAAILGVVAFLRSPHKLRYLVAATFIAATVYTVMPQRFWDRMATINASAEERDGSTRGRLHFWSVASTMAASKPLTGVGFSAYTSSYQSYNTNPEWAYPAAAHSIWFGTLGDLGYPGLFLFVSIWVLAVWSCWRISVSSKRSNTSLELGFYANGLLTSLIVYAAAGTFLSHQYYEMPWHFMNLSTALLLIAAKEVPVPAKAATRQVANVKPAFAR